jgi:phosphatidylglycerophosphate synthase
LEQTSNKTAQKAGLSFTDQMRVWSKGILDPMAGFFNRLGLMPNTMTILGLVGNTIGAAFIASGRVQLGGLIVLVMGPVDALDGAMARLRHMTGNFGAFVDSVTDRYSELVILLGLLYHFIAQENDIAAVVTFVAAAGSVLVSYVRARGQSLGWDTRTGILTRMERYLVLAPSLILNYPVVGMWIIAILANFTAIQRIIDIRRQAYQSPEEGLNKDGEK